MFQFPGFACRLVFNQPGFPIRTSTDQRLFATPRSFSQLTTSFVASESLGIPRMPFFCFLLDTLNRLRVSHASSLTRLLSLLLLLLLAQLVNELFGLLTLLPWFPFAYNQVFDGRTSSGATT
jgi:hypothetical protein